MMGPAAPSRPARQASARRINYAFADAALKLADPYIPRNRVDEATLVASTAFGPPAVIAGKIEGCVKGGGSKFVLRPLCPPEQMLDQLSQLAEEGIPTFHAR